MALYMKEKYKDLGNILVMVTAEKYVFVTYYYVNFVNARQCQTVLEAQERLFTNKTKCFHGLDEFQFVKSIKAAAKWC